jgi:hypothetical protein
MRNRTELVTNTLDDFEEGEEGSDYEADSGEDWKPEDVSVFFVLFFVIPTCLIFFVSCFEFAVFSEFFDARSVFKVIIVFRWVYLMDPLGSREPPPIPLCKNKKLIKTIIKIPGWSRQEGRWSWICQKSIARQAQIGCQRKRQETSRQEGQKRRHRIRRG